MDRRAFTDELNHTLCRAVTREDAWLFEATRSLLEQLGVHGGDEQARALLAETQTTLQSKLTPDALRLDELESLDQAHARRYEHAARWRDETEALSELKLRSFGERASASEHTSAAAHPNEASNLRAAPPHPNEASNLRTAPPHPNEASNLRAAPPHPNGASNLRAAPAQREEPRRAATHSTAAANAPNVDEANDLAALSPSALDDLVRQLSRSLACHEFELSGHIQQFLKRDGWHRLGYASPAHYARERLGMSRASFLGRKTLAARLSRLPQTSEALRTGEIGVEAARLIVRISTPRTEAAWLERARCRTVKHLREEVNAALTALRLSGETDCPPPSGGDFAAYQDLERCVISGRLFTGTQPSEPNRAADTQPPTEVPEPPTAGSSHACWHTMLRSLSSWLADSVQMSAPSPAPNAPHPTTAPTNPVDLRTGTQNHPRHTCESTAATFTAMGPSPPTPATATSTRATSAPTANPWTSTRAVRTSTPQAGHVELRLRVSASTLCWWRALESRARRHLPPTMSWLRFACLSVWQAWGHLTGADVAYGRIYIRDRCRCANPVCQRRDVTPHHLRFRSAGGGDDDANVIAVCTWCHLEGIHGGRIRATGTANDVRWELGPRSHPCVVVQGRHKLA